jgi:hypothetical protein
MLAHQTTGQPSPEVLKRRRERQWQKWDKQHQKLEEDRQVRKEAEWRAAKRERLLNTKRARTAELGACRQEAAARSARREEQAGADWAAQLKQMEETHAATKHIETREVSDQSDGFALFFCRHDTPWHDILLQQLNNHLDVSCSLAIQSDRLLTSLAFRSLSN